MMRYLDMPDGVMVRIPHGWDLFTYAGNTYRCMNGRVWLWRDSGWYPCAMAQIRMMAA